MSGSRSTVNRTNPVAGAGTNYHAVLQADSLVDAVSPQLVERVSIQWANLSFGIIGVTTLTPGDYPAETTTGLPGGTALQISSATGGAAALTLVGTPTIDPTGMIILLLSMVNGSNSYQPFRITAWNGTTGLTLNRNIPVTLSGADLSTNGKFKFLIDCEGMNTLFIKTEYSGATVLADLIPSFYDNARTPAGVVRIPMRFPGTLVTPNNQGHQTDITQSNYYHADAISVNCVGALGAKVRLNSAPTNTGSVSIWAAAS